ncbi:MAG: BMP family ABC transporter substrate-binding protein [Jatrophihabitantaceae bacterium]
MSQLSRGGVVGVGLAGVAALLLVGCASNKASAPKTSGTPPVATSSSGSAGASSSGSAGTSNLNEPDTNGDGKVVIGILSPGDIHDHGYYQSFVDAANAYAKKKGWTVITRGSVATADALNAARALCQQKVDMVALGASELKDAIPASEEAVCKNTAWYVPAAANLAQTPKIVISSDDPNQDLLAAGYAAGLLMKPKNLTKAGYVTGLKADFSVLAAKAFLAGIREVVPKASLLTAYTGDFNDSAKAKEATQAQLSQGAKVIYPYLGGGTDASAAAANAGGALTLTPGTDRCSSAAPKFDVSVIFDPGSYFLAALQAFAKNQLVMGTTKVWQMGVDPYPTVKLCHGTPAQTQMLAGFIKKIGNKTIDPVAEVKRLGG